MKVVIVAHGSLEDSEILERECQNSDAILCADGGAEFVRRSNIIPTFLIGDFDSIDSETLDFYKNSGTEILRYPCDKDFTDTELCIDKAIELGGDEISIVAGIGSRLDHSLGNIALLHKIAVKGIKGYIAGQDCYVYLCNKELILDGKKGDTVSILPFLGDTYGVSLVGLRYPLKNATICQGQSIGLSNVFIEEQCKITLEKGELLVIKTNNV